MRLRERLLQLSRPAPRRVHPGLLRAYRAALCAVPLSVWPSVSAVAAAEGPVPVSVWYRSSEGCPDGPAFVARLQELGRPAALANVGDRVDFVVTLAAKAESSAGRLERQTGRGTVAIREVESPACADVAEALALSLELTLEPAPPAASAALPTAPAGLEGVAAASAAVSPATEPAAAREPVLPPAPPAEAAHGLRFGAHASVASGIAPDLAPGAGLFVELPASALPADLRLTLHAAYQSSRVGQVQMAVALLGGELDACAWALRAGVFSLTPCLGIDVGVLQASSSGARASTDRGSWAAALALLRSQLHLWPALAPELQLAALLPFVRYTFGAPDAEDLYRVRTLGLELSAGVRWAP